MARSFYVEITAQATPTDPTDDLETFVSVLMDRLQDEPGAHDADVGTNLETGRIDFCFHLDAEDSISALRTARLLAHSAGATTAGWADVARAVEEDQVLASVRPADGGGLLASERAEAAPT